jgi:TRL (tRNA-associated locus)-like protein
MKKLVVGMMMLLGAGMFSGCATSMPVGILSTNLKLPVTATDVQGNKEGTSKCWSALFLFASGDCSIATAKKNGGITKVSSIDWEANNLLGFYGTYTTHVYGE